MAVDALARPLGRPAVAAPVALGVALHARQQVFGQVFAAGYALRVRSIVTLGAGRCSGAQVSTTTASAATTTPPATSRTFFFLGRVTDVLAGGNLGTVLAAQAGRRMSETATGIKRGARAMSIVAALVAFGLPQQTEEAPPLDDCIAIEPYAVYRGFGYDHIVRLASSCDADRECSVATDVNPSPILVIVPAGDTVEVLTFRGSPARVFHAFVQCPPRS